MPAAAVLGFCLFSLLLISSHRKLRRSSLTIGLEETDQLADRHAVDVQGGGLVCVTGPGPRSSVTGDLLGHRCVSNIGCHANTRA
jgi:hypothetical protein